MSDVANLKFAPLNPGAGEYRTDCYMKFTPLSPGEYIKRATTMKLVMGVALLIYSPGFKGANFIKQAALYSPGFKGANLKCQICHVDWNSGLDIIRSAVAFLIIFFLYQEKSHITRYGNKPT